MIEEILKMLIAYIITVLVMDWILKRFGW